MYKKYVYVHKVFLFLSQYDSLQLCSFVLSHEGKRGSFHLGRRVRIQKVLEFETYPIQIFNQDIVFSSACSFLEPPQVHTSKHAAKTAEMDFLTALES